MKIRCPHCRARLDVRDDLRGKTSRCPRCREKLCLVPDDSTEPALLDREDGPPERTDAGQTPTGSSSDEFDGVEPLGLFASRSAVGKKSGSVLTKSAIAGEVSAKTQRRRQARHSTWGMLKSVADRRFWRSALGQLPYLAAALALVGGLLGFLIGLVHSAVVAGLIFDLIGVPTAFVVFFMMSYPTSCFWKVVVGSAEGSGDLNEWPQGNYPEYVFEMLLVGYLVLISLFFSAGVAKLGQMVFADKLPSEVYWQLAGDEGEVSNVSVPPVLGGAPEPASQEDGHLHPVLRVGPGCRSMFFAFLVIFPVVVISCLDPITPILIPWSPRAFVSLAKNFPAWLAVLVISSGILTAAAAIFVLGITYAPFWTFTLCSPLAAAGSLVYGRLLGRLSWLIART
jgi:hypothetical protein